MEQFRVCRLRTGRAKKLSAPTASFLVSAVRAGFEPFRWREPHGSKPARLLPVNKQSVERVEFFALPQTSHVEVSYVQRVVFDERSAWLHHVTHQDRKHLVSLDRVILIELDLEQFPSSGIHRGREELLGVHFS